MFIQHFIQITDKATGKPISHFPCNSQEEARHVERALKLSMNHQAFELCTVSAPALVTSFGNVLEIIKKTRNVLLMRDNRTTLCYEIFYGHSRKIMTYSDLGFHDVKYFGEITSEAIQAAVAAL